MSLICLTFSHRHVPLSFREQIYFDSGSIADACSRFGRGNGKHASIIELSILSTCNRTEIYAFSNRDQNTGPDFETRDELLSVVRQVGCPDDQELLRLSKWIVGPEVVRHLSRVACGLESQVMGEPQILGQVGDAMRMGTVLASSGPVLTKLFQTAIRAGRRARAETDINRCSLNLSTIAVHEIEQKMGRLDNKTIVVLGAGETADLAISQLRKKGATRINVVNRTLAKATRLASKHDGLAFVFEQLDHLLPDTDILIGSTGAPHALVTHQMIDHAMQKRSSRPMMILDLAVPRDVEISVEEVNNVSRCDIDDLHQTIDQSVRLRYEEVPLVEEIIQSETDRFLNWYRGIDVASTIAKLRQKTDEIRIEELNRLSDLLPDLDEETWFLIQTFADKLINKVLHDPTVRLRHLDGTRDSIDHGEAIRQLFCLTTEQESASAGGRYP